MKKIFCFFVLLSVVFLFGCKSNKYMDNYSVVAQENEYIHTEELVKLVELADISQMKKLEENDDYILIGTSSFYDLWEPRIFAIQCAEKYGASLVIVEYQVGQTVDGSVTVNVPTTQTTYHHGSVYGSYGYANFHGSSTTYGSTPVTINYQNTYYRQTAYFFGKRKNKNSFGLYFHLPENIPGNKDKKIRIAIVVKNSPAEKQGIKTGDIVKSINGKEIKTPEDIMAFINGIEKIENIEVEHE